MLSFHGYYAHCSVSAPRLEAKQEGGMSFRSVPAHLSVRAQPGRIVDTHLSGRWLILARAAWIVLVVCILGYFIASLPETFVTLHQACSGAWCTNATGRLTASQIHSLLQVGISLDTYAW